MSESQTPLILANSIKQHLHNLDACLPEVATFASKAGPDAVLELEEHLQKIFMASIDQSDMEQLAGFIAIVHTLLPALPAASIITTWFDIMLRASLRIPELPARAVRQARELVLRGLQDESHPKTASFRRMIIDLYLAGTNKDSSEHDALEDVALDPSDVQKQTCWKHNIEVTLLDDAIRHPTVRDKHVSKASTLTK